ncbi:MAG: hypothetical protein RML14_06920 [Meiothermus sp.]|nr:hypothetical protein [Meiothermus sp.]MDW8481599.1 hypothetical protein [Meiothermus sp.]
MAFLYGTGLRLSEALGLTLGQLTHQDGVPYTLRLGPTTNLPSPEGF